MLPLGSSTGGASTGQSYELASKKEPAQRPSYRGLDVIDEMPPPLRKELLHYGHFYVGIWHYSSSFLIT